MVLSDVFAVDLIVVSTDVNAGIPEALALVGSVVVAEDGLLVDEIFDLSEERVLDVVRFIVVPDADVVSIVIDLIPVDVGSSVENVELVDTGIVNTEDKMCFEVEATAVEIAGLTDVLFIDAEAL